MKILGRHLFEKFKGFFATGSTPLPRQHTFWLGERSWKDRCSRNLLTYMNYLRAKSQVLTVAGQCVADGIFLQAATDEEPHGQRAKDALYECEQLNKQIRIKSTLHGTFFGMTLYGSCFWEKTTEPRFDTRIIPQQEAIEPAEQDSQGIITRWRQRSISGAETASWTQDEIIHFPWNITSWSWPYGTSLLAGLEQNFEILEQIKQDFKEYAHKNAFPLEMFAVGNGEYVPTPAEAEDIKSLTKTWEPGKKIITSYPIEHKVGGVGDREPKGIDKIMAYLTEESVDGTMTPPVSYQYNSTYASSKEMAKTTRANLIIPLQSIVAWELEQSLYKPYLESLGYSVKLCPTVNFDPPDANWTEEAQAYTQLVQAGILTPELAASEMGYTQEQIEQMRLEKLQAQKQQMELMRQRVAFTSQQQQQEGEEESKPQAKQPSEFQ